MLTAITHADQQEHPYLTVVLNFVRHCAEDIAGIFPRKQRLLLDKYGIQPQKSKVRSSYFTHVHTHTHTHTHTHQLLPKAKQEQFHNILRKYFASVKRHMVVEHKAMHKRERHNHHLLVTKGELSEERNMENETAQKAYDKLLTNTSTLAVSKHTQTELHPNRLVAHYVCFIHSWLHRSCWTRTCLIYRSTKPPKRSLTSPLNYRSPLALLM